MSRCYDHNGVPYHSTKLMCERYHISAATFCQRMKRGFTLEQALTMKLYAGKKTSTMLSGKYECEDHLGHKYPSAQAMCDAYGIDARTFCHRKQRGCTLQQALTRGRLRRGRGKVTDHRGNVFCSIDDMARFWNVGPTTYRNRLARGLSQAEALETQTKVIVTDHKGIQYRSQQEMCNKYGVKLCTFRQRRKYGFSLKECLTANPYERRKNNKQVCKDHMGHEYASMEAMCNAYGINATTFHYRITRGIPLQRALMRDRLPRKKDRNRSS